MTTLVFGFETLAPQNWATTRNPPPAAGEEPLTHGLFSLLTRRDIRHHKRPPVILSTKKYYFYNLARGGANKGPPFYEGSSLEVGAAKGYYVGLLIHN